MKARYNPKTTEEKVEMTTTLCLTADHIRKRFHNYNFTFT
jgi:hypothetical protein